MQNSFGNCNKQDIALGKLNLAICKVSDEILKLSQLASNEKNCETLEKFDAIIESDSEEHRLIFLEKIARLECSLELSNKHFSDLFDGKLDRSETEQIALLNDMLFNNIKGLEELSAFVHSSLAAARNDLQSQEDLLEETELVCKTLERSLYISANSSTSILVVREDLHDWQLQNDFLLHELYDFIDNVLSKQSETNSTTFKELISELLRRANRVGEAGYVDCSAASMQAESGFDHQRLLQDAGVVVCHPSRSSHCKLANFF